MLDGFSPLDWLWLVVSFSYPFAFSWEVWQINLPRVKPDTMIWKLNLCRAGGGGWPPSIDLICWLINVRHLLGEQLFEGRSLHQIFLCMATKWRRFATRGTQHDKWCCLECCFFVTPRKIKPPQKISAHAKAEAMVVHWPQLYVLT